MRPTPFPTSFSVTRNSLVHPPPSTRLSPRRALVVDDDQEVREVLVKLLMDQGYEVMPVMSGWEFLELRPWYPFLEKNFSRSSAASPGQPSASGAPPSPTMASHRA
jgi:hypothetical protein